MGYVDHVGWLSIGYFEVCSSTISRQLCQHQQESYSSTFFLILQSIGCGGYQANIFQFGIDQFPDASMNAIKSFVIWFVWSYFTGGIAGYYFFDCIGEEYHVVGQCFISVCLTVALVSSFLLNGILIKEPVVGICSQFCC